MTNTCEFRQFKELLQKTPYNDTTNYWDEFLFVLNEGTGGDVDDFLTNLHDLIDKETK